MQESTIWETGLAGEPIIEVAPREEVTGNAKIMGLNETYASIANEITALYAHGEIGRFQIKEPEYQPISPNLGVTRKVYLTHPDFPEKIFVATGIGIMYQNPEEINDNYTLLPPNNSPEYRHQLISAMSHTLRIQPDGDVIKEENKEPLGAYLPETARNKYESTQKVYDDELYGPDVEVCENVAWGQYDENMAFYMYTIPEGLQGAQEIFDSTKTEKEAYNKFVRSAFNALSVLNRNGYVSRQHHPGNVFWNPNTQRILVTDHETLQYIGDHKRSLKPGEKISAYAHAIWNDVQKSLFLFTNLDSLTPGDTMNFQEKIFEDAMIGYFNNGDKVKADFVKYYKIELDSLKNRYPQVIFNQHLLEIAKVAKDAAFSKILRRFYPKDFA